jgi:hypothetical protein
MLTSKEKIAEQILLRIRQDHSDTSIHENEIMLAVHQSLSSLMRVRLFEGKSGDGQDIDGSLYYSIDALKVSKNSKDQYYVQMPSTSVTLPFGVDIKRVGPDKGKGYVHVQNGFSDLYHGLASSLLEGQIGYYKSGINLVFVNMNGSNYPETTNIELAIPFDALEDDDMINIPTDMLDEVIEAVIMKFTKTLEMPEDEVNNNIDD